MRGQMIISFIPVLSVGLLVGCGAEPKISYKSDVKPLIDKYCLECHTENGDGAKASGFITDTYESVMTGTKYGPVIVPGDALSSSFYRLVSGKVHSSIQMPHGKEALNEKEISTIEQWIVQGASNN